MIVLYFTFLLLWPTVESDLQDADFKFSNRDDNELKAYPLKRGIQPQGPYYIIPPEDQEVEVEYPQSHGRYRHLEDTPIYDYVNVRSDPLKRYGRRADRLKKRDLGSQVKEPFGLVYSKGRLVGILEPYTDLYQLAPLSNVREGMDEMQPLPLQSGEGRSFLTEPSDDSEKDETGQSEYARYADEKYPMILADFKIDSKLNAMNSHKSDSWPSSKDKKKSKHTDAKVGSKQGITDERISELSSALHRIKQADGDAVEAIEEDLRGLLSDMGLIDSEAIKKKRDASPEDENLEEGSNIIPVVKATHDPDKNDRKKRAENNVSEGENLRSTASASNVETGVDKREATTDAVVKNYQSEGEEYVRNKRHETSTESSDIMKGLQKSGDLTVSGNKSPLASSENKEKITEKRKDGDFASSTARATTVEDYEKQLEKNIQQRIEAIKEEVKREIASLQEKSAPHTISDEDSQRKKRETANTLLEKESKKISPLDHPEGPLVSHIRAKRTLKNHSRAKRDIYGDYFVDDDSDEENGEEELEDEEYVVDNEGRSTPDTNIKQLSSGSTQKVFNNTTVSTSVGSTSQQSTKFPVSSTSMETLASSPKPLPTTESSKQSKESKSPRKRRQASIIHTRKKRAQALVPDGNSAYLPYRADDEDVDEEGDEFDDDGFDDRTAGLRKREVNRNLIGRYSYDYPNILEYDEPYAAGEFVRKYPIRKYVTNLNSDVYDNVPSFLHDPSQYIRRKRNNFDHLIALHGGGATVHHLAAVRERNARRQSESESRKKRKFERSSSPTEDSKQEQQGIADLSDTDLFGALPQSYEGELSRFKRVKRKVAAVKGEG